MPGHGVAQIEGGGGTPPEPIIQRRIATLQARRPRLSRPLQVDCLGAKAEARKHLQAVLGATESEPGKPAVPLVGAADATEAVCAKIAGTPLDRYRVLETLGQGSYGVVHRAERRDDGLSLALKIVRTTSDEFDTEFLGILKKEYQILKTIEHPHIIRAYDFFTGVDCAVLVMELFDGPSLDTLVRNSDERHLKETTARALFSQLLQAIDHLHQHRIVHRDVKAANILVSQDRKDLRLVDFNTARCLAEGMSLTMTGTVDYAAPEILQGESPSECGDIWSAGLCLHVMLAGRLPRMRDQYSSLPDFAEAVASGKVTLRGKPWHGVSETSKSLLQQCLEVKSSLRPTAATLLCRHYPGNASGVSGSKLRCSKLRRNKTICADLLPSSTKSGDVWAGAGSFSNPAHAGAAVCVGVGSIRHRGSPGVPLRLFKRARSVPSPMIRLGG
jgi:serine/threonine protein kinase